MIAIRKSNAEEMTRMDINYISKAILSDDPDVIVFTATDNDEPCGFIHMSKHQDYYTLEQHVHISDVMVTELAQGKGIGKLLLQQADTWAKENNIRWVTLNVFETNTHAQAVYEKLGFILSYS